VHWPFEPPESTAYRCDPTAPAPDATTIPSRPAAGLCGGCSSAPIRVWVKILAALDRRGLTSNTLVIFTNDNGGEWLSRNCAPLPPQGDAVEGGIRVPLILRWPGQLPAAKTSAQVAITFDLTGRSSRPTRPALPEGLPPGWDRTCCPSCGVTPRWSNAGFLAHQSPRSPAAGRQVWSLEVAGRRRSIPAVRSRRRPGERTDLAARHLDIVVGVEGRRWPIGRRMSIRTPKDHDDPD